MTRKQTKDAHQRRCLEIIENCRQQQFSKNETKVELTTSDVTSIFEAPERLNDSEEAELLFLVLSNKISDGSYEDSLSVCTHIVQSNFPRKVEVVERIGGIFTLLLAQLLRIEKKEKVDYHVILAWLESGDVHFSKESHMSLLNEKSYALLKAAHLVVMWKKMHECFTCGCVQKQIIELFTENNCTRLFEALHSISKSRVSDLNPTFRRIFQSMVSDIDSIDTFGYYIEILQELRQCSAFDPSDEKMPSSLIQLTGLLCEMKDENVPTACFEMHRFLVLNDEVKEKKNGAVEMAVRSRLVPKIFDSVNNNRKMKLDNFGHDSVQKFVDLIERESYSSFKETLMFAPLQLLNFLFSKHDIWAKSKNYVNKRIDSLNLSTQQGPVIAFYLLGLIYKHDCSLLKNFVEVLKKQYVKAHINNKKKVLLILEIIEKAGNSNPVFFTYFEKRVKIQLLLETDLDSVDNVKLVLEYLLELNSHELNQFLQKKSQSLTEYLDDLFGKIKDADIYVTSDDIWQWAIEVKSSNRDVIEFIRNQLNILIAKKDRTQLTYRLALIFRQLRSVSPSTRLPPRELILAIPKILLSFPNTEYSLLPHTTTSSIIPLLIISYCFFFVGSEKIISDQFRLLLRKGKNGEEIASEDPLEMMEAVCEVIKSGKTAGFDMNFMKQEGMLGGGETFLKTMKDVVTDDSLRNSFTDPESFARTKERIVQMSSVLFGSLSAQLQALGDHAKTPFCQIAIMIEKFITATLTTSSKKSSVWEISERTICGFAKMTEKWNSLFVRPRVMKILNSSRSHNELLKGLITITQKNKVLVDLLKKKDDYSQLEALAK